MSVIPADLEMKNFKDKLKTYGLSEVERKINQKIWRKDDWKYREALNFIENIRRNQDLELKKESLAIAEDSNRISKHANKIAYFSLVVSVVAILLAFFK